MLRYQLRLAWKSLRRNPVLSLITIAGIALGIAVAMTFVTAYYFLAGNPIPQKSERLFYVQIDAWNPQRPWDDDRPEEAPDQLTYRDALAVMKSTIPTHATSNYKAELTVHPERSDLRPYREVVRMCDGDFFRMFDVPFRFGGPWGAEADEAAGQVVVLSTAANDKLFGGADSTGRELRIEDRTFRVAGVLDPWRPLPKFYDTLNGPLDEPEEIYMPFSLGRELEVHTAGNTSGWGNCGDIYSERLESECIWIQTWVQLDDAEQREAFVAFLDSYAAEQKAAGRHGRPINNKLRDLMAWLRHQEVVPDEARTLLIIALLFLLVCSVNLIGVLLGKFLARAPEVGVRRALGASRGWVFVQHLLECELVGVLGGLAGLLLSLVSLRLLDKLFQASFEFRLDPTLFLVALGLALVSALIAGVYPAWRICRVEPALHLKM